MKSLKYNFAIALSLLSLLLPAIVVALAFAMETEINAFAKDIGLEIAKPNLTIVLPFGLVLGVVGLLLQGKIREFRIATRRDVEYDEYGLSKSKGRYERLSKAERDAIDLQKTADMERLVNSTAIKKMTQHGPENPMQVLDEMIGLEPVKESVKEMVARMQFEVEEAKKNKKGPKEALSGRHMCFTGAPGTGKTTVARIMTSFLHEYGYIKENKCIEIDGNFLKAGTESAIKTEMILRNAYGGVLFIDEAYALMDSSDNSGEQVIATLIKQMEDQRGRFILIIAGYTNEMKQLIDKNPGFESRIKDYLHFPDYDAMEMRDILKYMAGKQKFSVDPDAFPQFDRLVVRERGLRSFGNARTVRNILDKAIDKHSLNIVSGKLPQESRYVLCEMDFQNLKLGGIGFEKEW